MTHTPDKKQELIEQLRNLSYTDVDDDFELVADFILARDAGITSEVSTNPPLDTEELEKQIQSIINHAKWNVGFVPDPESPKWQENVKFEAKEILALVTQHTQVAGHQHKFVTHSVDMGEWTNVERYCEICGVDYKQLEQRKPDLPPANPTDTIRKGSL